MDNYTFLLPNQVRQIREGNLSGIERLLDRSCRGIILELQSSLPFDSELISKYLGWQRFFSKRTLNPSYSLDLKPISFLGEKVYSIGIFRDN
jgi:hypothetical protein